MINLPLSLEAFNSDIPARFAQVVAQCASKVAATAEMESLTYAELDRRSAQVAAALTSMLGDGEEPVALLTGHDLNLVIGLMGILRAGRPYVASPPASTASALSGRLAFLQSPILLCDDAHRALAIEAASGPACEVICVGRDTDGYEGGTVRTNSRARQVAAISLTSGSTGQPKGVMRGHHGLLHRVWLDQELQMLISDDRISLLYGAAFGASQADLFGALLSGATICLYDVASRSLAGLAPWIQGQGITRLHLPVELFRQWLDLLPQDVVFDSLRQVAPAGRILRSDLERARRHLPPGCTIISRLASAESGLVAQIAFDAHAPIADEVLPVGYVVPDIQIKVVDEQGIQVSQGETGEALVCGLYLAMGYWRNPELTAQAFVPEPSQPGASWYHMGDLVRERADGCLEFHGRRDERVKVSGYSVELAAVEAALCSLEHLAGAAVLAPVAGADGERRLVAYVASTYRPAPTVSELRRGLAANLPPYMIPGTFVFLDALPLTANGKIDRRALPPLGGQRPSLDTPYVGPRNDVEARIADVWADVLGLDAVGILDSFLDLGGDSLKAARIAAQLERRFGFVVSGSALLSAPTVADMAGHIQAAGPAAADTNLETLLAGIEELSEHEATVILGDPPACAAPTL